MLINRLYSGKELPHPYFVAIIQPDTEIAEASFGFGMCLNSTSDIMALNYGYLQGGTVLLYQLSTQSFLREIANPDLGDYFGNSMTIAGTTIAIGSYGADDPLTDSGAVYLCNTSDGSLIKKIINPNEHGTEQADAFGRLVDYDGTDLVATAPFEDTELGALIGYAYVIDQDTGLALQSIVNPNYQTGSSSDGFGSGGISLSAGKLLVGAAFEDVGGVTSTGIAYMFDVGSGATLRTYLPEEPTQAGRYGASVSMNETYTAIGAYDEGGSGRVHIYDTASGSLLRTLSSPNPEVGGDFGKACDISGSRIVVGANYENNEGAAYVFDMSNGNLISTLKNEHIYGTVKYFGTAVKIDGDYVLVNSYDEFGETTGFSGVGAVYLYDLSL